MDKAERGIVTAGLGWTVAGVLALVLCVYQKGSDGLFAVGMLALGVGTWIVYARRKIVKIRNEILQKRKSG